MSAAAPHSVLILGIDPGLRHTGFGLIRKEASRLILVGSGAFSTKAADPLSLRLCQLADALKEVLERFKPQEVAMEEIFMNKNPASSMKLMEARGALLLTAASRGLPIFAYSARRVKKALTGTGGATKEQIALMIRRLLPAADPKSHDEADALALAVTHAHYGSTERT